MYVIFSTWHFFFLWMRTLVVSCELVIYTRVDVVFPNIYLCISYYMRSEYKCLRNMVIIQNWEAEVQEVLTIESKYWKPKCPYWKRTRDIIIFILNSLTLVLAAILVNLIIIIIMIHHNSMSWTIKD